MNPLTQLCVFLIFLYRKFKPERLKGACIYTPTCSEYMLLSLRKHGFLKGLKKGISRIKRCDEISTGGIDYP